VSSHVAAPQIDIDAIVACFTNTVRKSSNEEELRIGVSRCIEDMVLKPLGIKEVGRYEYLLVSGARVDALYGHVVVEFKAPGKLAKESDIQRAKEQVIKYITQEAGSKQEWRRYLGVIISDRIAFVRHDPRTDTWILRGPYDIRREVVVKLIEAIRGLRRKPLDVDHLLRDFGPASPITRKLVTILYKKLLTSKNARTRVLFEDWMRLFKQATGYKPEELEELPKLASEYGLVGKVDYDTLIFSIHTYYALLLKLIAAEIAYLYGAGKFYKSYIAELDDAYSRGGLDGLREILQELETGGIFRKLLRIENFLEGDYFSWYLDELDKDLGDAIAELIRVLSDYEIATPQLEPEFARDLLKRLYQNLVPSDLRHRLGEYYTPDWLANLILDEVGLSLDNLRKMGEEDPLKPLGLKILDPACGSGTFLILYISRLRRYAEEHFLLDTLLNYVLDNVVGYDLNPLAVLTARTNYLLAIADLLAYARGSIEIPVYLADSIMIEKRAGLYGNTYVLRTVVGEFEIPVTIVEKGLLHRILAEIVGYLESRYSVEDFKKRMEYAYKLDQKEISTLAKFYEKLLKLEEEGKNSVWISIIRNAFAPILKGKFDYIVGNPPWVNWENLPEEYREISKSLWEYYGLAKMRGKVGLGKVKRDLAMLFLVRSLDLYLKERGKLGFLMPFTALKVQAGAGFRSFLAKKTKIHVVHDLVTLYPFEGATNRTSAIVVEKICEVDLDRIPDNMKEICTKALGKAYEENMNGIKHIIWVNPTNKPIPTDKPLEEVLRETKRYEAIMLPLKPGDPGSPWMQVTPKVTNVIRKLLTGTQYYEAHEGINVALNQVYYVQVKGKTPDGKLVITNPPEPSAKKKVKQVEAIVEPDLVYPLIRGRDIKKWYADLKNRYIILPVDSQGNDIAPGNMRVRYPNAYNYFYNFFNELVNRGGEPYKSKLEPYRRLPIEKAEKMAPPFYWVFNVKPSLAPYKVVWKRIAGAITGKAVSFACAVVEPIGGKPVVPDDSTIMVEAETPEEAYYIAGLLNSTIIRTIIASYTYELRQETHIADVIKIPKFDPSNGLHKRIADLSRRAHELAKCIYAEKKPDYCRGVDAEQELKNVEREIDVAVAQLFGLSEDDVREFEKLMAILSGEELPSEEEEVEVPKEPSVTVLNTLIPPNTESYIEVEVANPSGEEISMTYEFPWGKGSFNIVEGRQRIQVPPLSPGKYSGVVKYVWRGVEKVINVAVEVSDVSGPKRQRRLVS
jgi:type II restriction/modification system DNA methylase subunit YeeA